MAALALGGCSQTGQQGMQASFAPDGGGSPEGAPIGQVSENEAVSANPAGFAAFFAPRRTQVAEVVENIPGDFQAPENAPLPPSRPDFGDRVQTALAPGADPQTTGAISAHASGSPAPGPAAVTATAFAPTHARAEAASLGAYEFKTAGVPMPEGGLRAAPIAFAPAQFELAGVRAAPLARGGQRWRPAYDNVETDCFPETLRKALDQLAAHFKSEVLVTSGKRDRGRRGSLHRACKAADVRIVGVAPSEIARVARDIPGVNGVGTYRRADLTHIDVRAERFAWRW